MAAEHARAMTGHYIASDRSASNFLAINSFRFPTVVEINDEGQLVISSLTGADGAPKRWREVAPFLWHEVGGNDRLAAQLVDGKPVRRSEEHTSELQSLMRISYAVFCLKKKNKTTPNTHDIQTEYQHTTLQYTISITYT